MIEQYRKDGIITRLQYNEVPPHVDYTMTKKGKNVIPALTMLGDWAKGYMKEEKLAPECEECLQVKNIKNLK